MGNVVVLKNYQYPEEKGCHYRIVCMTGKKRGEVYYIKSKRILLGRSREADITIYDSQSSREHVELSRVGSDYILTDLNSNNGVFVNGKKVKQVSLKTKDRITIGTTIYKYEIIDVESSDVTRKAQVKKDKGVVKEEKGKKRKGTLILILLAGVAFLALEEDGVKNKKIGLKKMTKISRRSIQRESPRRLKKNKEVEYRLNTIIQRGIRELREKNYYRAIGEFNLALIVDPKAPRALAYRRKAKDLLDKEIESYFDQAARDFSSFHYDKAIKNYCQIIKIMEDLKEDERYKSAKENLEELVVTFGVRRSAINCY